LAFPIFPKTAPGRGALFVPHVNQEQDDYIEFDITLCAIFLRVLTTTTAVAGVAGWSSISSGTELVEVVVPFFVAISL